MTKMDKSVQKTLIIVGGVVFLALIGLLVFQNLSPSNTVTGNGQATIKVLPDLVGVYFSVETTAMTSVAATESNSDIVDKLVDSLMDLGFAREKIQTTGFSVYPNYEWVNGQQIDKGFRATHSIRVEMPSSDSSKIGSVIDAGVEAGAGISYINFELSTQKENEYKSQALKSATEDARTKADAIASGLDKNLGRFVSVSDTSFNYYPWPLYAAREGAAMDASEAKAATTNIVPAEQDISASVIAVFKLS